MGDQLDGHLGWSWIGIEENMQNGVEYWCEGQGDCGYDRCWERWCWGQQVKEAELDWAWSLHVLVLEVERWEHVELLILAPCELDLLGIISFLANGLGWNPLTHNPSHRHQAQLLQAVHHHQPLIKTQIIRHHQQALPSPTYQTKKGVFIHSKQIKGTKELLGFCFQCQAR